jgi:hypothetical protein
MWFAAALLLTFDFAILLRTNQTDTAFYQPENTKRGKPESSGYENFSCAGKISIIRSAEANFGGQPITAFHVPTARINGCRPAR